jgi:hypothetical protein
MHLFKWVIFTMSVFSTALSGAQEVSRCRILGHLTKAQIIQFCKDVAESKSETDGEVAHAANMVGHLLQLDKAGGTPEEAIGYFLLAAQKGKLSAFAAIGDIYREGYRDQKPDYKKAIRYYDQDTSRSPTFLKGTGEMYLHGYGVIKSVDDAINRFRVAAYRDDSDARIRSQLCDIYSSEDYQKKDLVKAHFWCSDAVNVAKDPLFKGIYETSKINIEMQLSKSQLIESNRIKKECSKFGLLRCGN